MILGVFMCSATWGDCGGICAFYPRGGDIERKMCGSKNYGEECNDPAAVYSVCVKNKRAGVDTNWVKSCAARICKPGYLLWVYGNNINTGTPYGRCRSETYLQNKFCNKGKKKCEEAGCPGDCVVWKQTYTWGRSQGGYTSTDAYVDKQLCRCGDSAPEQTQTTMNCTYIFRAYCSDLGLAGKDYEIVLDSSDGESILPIMVELTQEKLRDAQNNGYGELTEEMIAACTNGEMFDSDDKSKLSQTAQKLLQVLYKHDLEWLKGEMASRDSLLREAVIEECQAPAGSGYVEIGHSSYTYTVEGTSGNSGNHVAINNAKSVLSSFFARAESDASVWKNAEGKFNAARLASDLTSAVVLGTVGGVVSAVVIKKNQVKKGFESLECYIHGYKVADWGDVFEASLRTR